MLARRILVAAVIALATGSSASAQVIGHSPGPRTRYEWNTNRPYSGGWSYNGGPGYGGGVSIGIGVGVPWGGYGYYGPYGGDVIVPPYGYGGYGPYYPGGGYTVLPPSVATYGYVPGPIFTGPPQPPVIPQPNPLEAVDELESRLNAANNLNRPIPKADRLPVLKPSTPEQQQRSLRHMATADQQFKIGHYNGAALEYRRAIADAEDLPDNYFGLGFALAAQRRYDEAVQQWKYGLMLDQSWPTRGQSLTALFGENNQFEKTALLNRAADYVRQDPRNPDRIFLLGVLIYFDGDQANARTLFESATRVAGNEPYLTAFLGTDQNVATAPGAKAPNPGVSAPPKAAPPAADPNNNSSIPAPPPANVRRERTSVPPARLAPQEAQPIPQRDQPANPPADEVPSVEKIPNLQVPKLPMGDI
jgi:Flp pilus assembly protein TadD